MRRSVETTVLIVCFLAILSSGATGLSRSGALPASPPPGTNRLIVAERPAIRVYTDKDGLPQNSVQAVAVDSKGFLWVGTQDGAAFYNGRTWTPTDLPNKRVSNFINQNAVLVDSRGVVWFGTRDGGACRFDNENPTALTKKDGLAGDNVNCILESKADGAMWFGTYGGGLSRLLDGRWTTFDASSGLAGNKVLCLMETLSPNGPSLWVGTDGNGVSCFHKGVWTTFTTSSGLPDNKIWSMLETKESDGRSVIWVGTESGGIGRHDSGTWTVFDRRSGLPSNAVYGLCESRDERGNLVVWAATMGGGLAKFHLERWTVLTSETGLPSNLIRTVFAASSDGKVFTLWIGTDGGGVVRLRENAWKTVSTPPGLVENKVQCLLETSVGADGPTLWVGTFGGGLFVRRGETWRRHDAKSGLPSDMIRCLLETTDAAGAPTMWIGTNNGLVRVRNPNSPVFESVPETASTVVFCLHASRAESGAFVLWVGTGKGLMRFQEGAWTTYRTDTGLADNSVRSILVTRDERNRPTVWVGTLGGLSRLFEGTWTTFATLDGLPNLFVRSLVETSLPDGGRVLWVGTSGGACRAELGGDARNSIGKFAVISTKSKPSLPSDVVTRLSADAQGRVYAFTLKGIARIDGEGRTVEIFTTEDGLPSNECNGEGGTASESGRMWAGTIKGVALYEPGRELTDRTPKPLRFLQASSFKRDDEPGTAGRALSATLAHDENHVLIEYALLSFFRESETRYRTQLVGFDPKPSDWTPNFSKEYSSLEAGNYEFLVWGRDYAGNVSGPVQIAFTVKPSPWKTIWAYFLYLSAGGAVAYSLYLRRVSVLKRQNQLLELKVAERTAAVLEREDSLKQANAELKQANELKTELLSIAAHDLKNPLTIIMTYSELIGMVRPDDAKVANPARSIFQSAKRMLETINGVLSMAAIESGRLKLVKTVTDARQIVESVIEENEARASAKSISIHFHAENATDFMLEADERRLREIIDNLVSNAVKYSPPSKRVWVKIERTGAVVRIKVRDEGPGFTDEDKAKLFGKFQRLSARPTGGESSTGLGLSIVKQLVELHGGSVRVESAPGEGATFVVELPAVKG